MQNGAEDGSSTEYTSSVHQQKTTDRPPPTSNIAREQSSPVISHPAIQGSRVDTSQNETDTPPAKRRKLPGPETSKQHRGSSPPWKKVQVEGPSTFHEGGVRKSARTNHIPVDLKPQSDKRKTRGAVHQGRPLAIKSKYDDAPSVTAFPETLALSPISNGVNGHKRPSVIGKLTSSTIAKSPKSMKSIVSGEKYSLEPPSSSKKSKTQPKPFASQFAPTFSSANNQKPRKVGRPRRAEQPDDHVPQVSSGMVSSASDGLVSEVRNGIHSCGDSLQKPQRLSLKLNVPVVGIYSLGNVVRRTEPPHYDKVKPALSAFEEWLEKEGRFDVEEKDKKLKKMDLCLTETKVQKEARIRDDISKAARPGGLLSRENCSYWNDEEEEKPPRLYTHQDRLLKHMSRFQWLLGQEKKKHLRAAKECAQHAAAFVQAREEKAYREWKKEQPKSAEEIAREQHELWRRSYMQMRQDIEKKWLMVAHVVDELRLQRWQAEQERLGKELLNDALEKSSRLLSRQRRRSSSPSENEDEFQETDATSQEGSSSDLASESADESNMSSSGSDGEDEQSLSDGDAALTQEELRRKYETTETSMLNKTHDPGDLGSPRPDNDQANEHVQADIWTPLQDHAAMLDPPPDAGITLEEVDSVLMDDSDESADMDDDVSSTEHSSSGDADSGSDQSEEDGFGMLGGFYSIAEKERMSKAHMLQTEATKGLDADFEASDDEADKVSLIADVTQGPTPSVSTSEESQLQGKDEINQASNSGKPPSKLLSEANIHEDKSTEDSGDKHTDTAMSEVQAQDVEMPATPVSTQNLKTSVPSLLRGTLREYQHYGLDWLAQLYTNDANGILADEMGLGKTIQTIALLAHVAEDHETWGPHLIIVPTSVMLNWEMEFKKFLPGFKVLTYYGTQEERKRKRTGWLDQDKYNVWITSYNLITQDQQVFKRKAWHYMILDEAHNIKNFQSLRWQTLIKFRTRARLLLTGTPLQNNLTELWSLLYFLMPSDESGQGIAGFTNLEDFTGWFKKPSEQILEQGREALDDDARIAVRKLHDILRPYLLRRLKADVEKQMPGKTEHVVYCRLSKRQRYLYDGFMSRAQTRETLASGHTFSIMNALMQLRKVCNHPDLFETRQIVTSFAMPKSAVADYEIKEFLVRRRLLNEEPMTRVDLNLVNLLPGSNESMSALDTVQKQRLGALGAIRQLTSQQGGRVNWKLQFDGSSVKSTLAHFQNNAHRLRYDKLHQTSYLTSLRSQRRPLFNYDLMDRLKFGVKTLPHQPMPRRRHDLSQWYTQWSPALHDVVLALPERSEMMAVTIQKFACITPAVVAPDIADLTFGSRGIQVVEDAKRICPQDPFHESRIRQSIAFPDKRLLQYDCGKLQQLDSLLRRLQTEGHRALIFTQMTRVLDILEQFMNIHGHRYLRLDGATKLEQRQMLTERFNNDNRILAFILSSRSGGIGINLTGADTVIFYDLDWNPAMDKQCQDRCHRIGQTRDVHIYRMVSEHTIEANILRKANQKRMLDDVVIQEGEFTTDYFNNMSVKDIVGDDFKLDVGDDAANAAIDRVLGKQGRVLEAVEDQDDAKAAKEAEKEIARYDAEDFDERGSGGNTNVSTPKTPGPAEELPPAQTRTKGVGDVGMTTTLEAAESWLAVPSEPMVEEVVPSCDDYMIRFLDWELKDVPMQPPVDKKQKKRVKESLGRKK